MKKFIIIFTLHDIIIVSNTQVYGKLEKKSWEKCLRFFVYCMSTTFNF